MKTLFGEKTARAGKEQLGVEVVRRLRVGGLKSGKESRLCELILPLHGTCSSIICVVFTDQLNF